jgi:CRISPR-associated protein Cas2
MPPAKQFLVVAYDIVSDRRRARLVKLLRGYGRRVNYSVFECSLKVRDIQPLKEKIAVLINPGEDSVLYYQLCRSCEEQRQVIGQVGRDAIPGKLIL